MALDPLHDRIARIALALPQARTLALAGGGAMIAHGLVDRTTRDVDLFTEVDADEAVDVAAALRSSLTGEGLVIEDSARPPYENRFVVIDPVTGASTSVEVFPDGGRLRPRALLDVGPVLHRDDLAADKTLALWARAEPRDFVDVVALRTRYGGNRLLELAAEKDRGFTVPTFIEALRSIRRLRQIDWDNAGIPPHDVAQIEAAVEEWCRELSTG
jgi:hypothetical protein